MILGLGEERTAEDLPQGKVLALPANEKGHRTVLSSDICSDLFEGNGKDSIPRTTLQPTGNCLKPVTRGQNLSFPREIAWDGQNGGRKIPSH